MQSFIVLINAVDGCGDHTTTKPVDLDVPARCIVMYGGRGQCKMESRVPEFILDIYVCPYQEVYLDLHVMISVMYANLSVQLNCAPSAYLRTQWL